MTTFRKLVRDSQVEWLWENYPHKCVWCKKKLIRSSRGRNQASSHALTVDHFMPVSRGGPNIRENMFLSCYRCNQQRGNLGATRFAHYCMSKGYNLDLTDFISYIRANRERIAGIEEYKHFDRYLKDKESGFMALRIANKDPLQFKMFLMRGKQRKLFLASHGI